MGRVVDLLSRPTYGLAQVDSLLGLQAGESQDAITEVYELPRESVQAAVRYELLRAAA